jgi:hypothetical protein
MRLTQEVPRRPSLEYCRPTCPDQSWSTRWERHFNAPGEAIQGVNRVNEARAVDVAGRFIRVRVWFGRFPIVDYTTSAQAASGQAQGLSRRFSGLAVTMDPVDAPGAVTTGGIR